MATKKKRCTTCHKLFEIPWHAGKNAHCTHCGKMNSVGEWNKAGSKKK
jgi:DNA-directed RNA polymerase subunit RPC12/RpoP